MINLDQGEQIQIILHHHWITFLGPLVLISFLVIIPLAILPLISSVTTALFFFLACIWYLMTLFLALGFWIDYYLDALVITDKRILNINQSGIFKHTVSEFRLEKVQDVTIEIPNFLATALHFGNIKIQTAGEMSFTISEVPEPHIARDLILKRIKQ